MAKYRIELFKYLKSFISSTNKIWLLQCLSRLINKWLKTTTFRHIRFLDKYFANAYNKLINRKAAQIKKIPYVFLQLNLLRTFEITMKLQHWGPVRTVLISVSATF